ncbi:MAG: hypothetical protein LBH34_04105 [Prevotellaceae bacterium]|nr:hypothetical protein [Prevotellaceae bacterium]
MPSAPTVCNPLLVSHVHPQVGLFEWALPKGEGMCEKGKKKNSQCLCSAATPESATPESWNECSAMQR